MAFSGVGHISSQRMQGVCFGPGETAIVIEVGLAAGMLVFQLLGQTRDGPGGANLSAERAGILAVALLEDQARHEPWGEHARQAGLEDGRLEHVGRANFHALAAADAQAEEGLFVGGARRTDQVRRHARARDRVGRPRRRPGWRPPPRCPPTRRAATDPPAAADSSSAALAETGRCPSGSGQRSPCTPCRRGEKAPRPGPGRPCGTTGRTDRTTCKRGPEGV